MVQAEHKTEHKPHTSPIRNTPDKLSSVMNNRSLRDLTNLLEPYKRNHSETPINTLTHIVHCYDRAHKLLQTLDLDSQRFTQSSQAIQSALESITALFKSTNFIKLSTGNLNFLVFIPLVHFMEHLFELPYR